MPANGLQFSFALAILAGRYAVDKMSNIKNLSVILLFKRAVLFILVWFSMLACRSAQKSIAAPWKGGVSIASACAVGQERHAGSNQNYGQVADGEIQSSALFMAVP
jgi:hypothetical protein